MESRCRVDQILGIILMVLALVCLVEGFLVWNGMGGTGFMPVIMGGVFAGLSLGLLISWSGKRESSNIPWPSRAVWIQISFIFLAMVFYILLLPWVGYLLGTTILLGALVWNMGRGRISWKFGLIFGVVVSTITYVVFKKWLNMPFPSGFFGI